MEVLLLLCTMIPGLIYDWISENKFLLNPKMEVAIIVRSDGTEACTFVGTLLLCFSVFGLCSVKADPGYIA